MKLPHADTDSVISLQFQFTLQKNSTFILIQNRFYLSREDSYFCKVSNNKSFSVGVQSPTEINAPRECAVILKRICQLSLTRITHQVSHAFDLNRLWQSIIFAIV